MTEKQITYRTEFLKSEHWQNLRIQALSQYKAKCILCQKEDFHNDVHHIEYPKNLWDTYGHQLVVLCRSCHTALHQMLKIMAFKKNPAKQWALLNLMRDENIVPVPLEDTDCVIEKIESIDLQETMMVKADKKCMICGDPTDKILNLFESLNIEFKKQYMHPLCDACAVYLKRELSKPKVVIERPGDPWKWFHITRNKYRRLRGQYRKDPNHNPITK